MFRIYFAFILSVASFSLQASAGSVLYVLGQVTVERDGKLYKATRHAKLKTGDLIQTRDGARVHLRMTDHTMISLKPNSEFLIRDYRHSASDDVTIRPAVQTGTISSDVAHFSLLAGGLRVITGLIGQTNRKAFEVGTPIAVIGIRGTSFVADLSANSADTASSPDALELTVGVSDGEVEIRNQFGEVLLAQGEFGRVTGTTRSPQRLIVAPADSEAVTQTAVEPEDVHSESTEETADIPNRSMDAGAEPKVQGQAAGPEPMAPTTEYYTEIETVRSYSASFNIDGRHTTASEVRDAEAVADAEGRLIAFEIQGDALGSGSTDVEIGESGRVVNFGRDSMNGIQWGRWSTPAVRQRNADGSTVLVDGQTANAHVIESDSYIRADFVMPSSGVRDYVLRGNTDPTDTAGHQGVLGLAAFRADFNTGIVASSLRLSMNQSLWQASGQGDIASSTAGRTRENTFRGDYSNVSVDGLLGGDGEFSGFFSDGAAGAGLSYRLSHGGSTINGVIAFEEAAQ